MGGKVVTLCDRIAELEPSSITQGAGAVRGVEVFVELVGELAVVAGFSDLVPRRRIGGEKGFFLTLSLDPNSY